MIPGGARATVTPRAGYIVGMAATKKRRKKSAPVKRTVRTRDIVVRLKGSLLDKFQTQARLAGASPEEHAYLLVDNGVAVDQLADQRKRHAGVQRLAAIVRKLPGVHGSLGICEPDDAFWWIKFTIDRRHELAWHVVQRLAFVLNYYSLEYKFPVKFFPASPPPYLNGGPEFLSWVIEATVGYLDPGPVTKVLRATLPRKLGAASEWREYDTGED